MALSDWGLTKDDAQYLLSSRLHSQILEVLAYGVYIAIYSIALYLTLSRGTGKAQVRSAILITILWLLVTLSTACRWVFIDDGYIRHANSRESQLIALSNLNKSLLAADITNVFASFLSVLFADATMIWRCWVLYGKRWIVVVMPILSLTLGTVVYLIQTVTQFTSEGTKTPILLATFNIIFLVTTVFTNLYCTIAIVYRLVSVGGFTRALRTYHGILEILIESAILYTSIYLIQIGLSVHSTYFGDGGWDERALFAEAISTVITGVAPTLMIARVAAGHARPNDSWTRTSLPHMRTTMHLSSGSVRFARPLTNNGTITEPEVDRERNIGTQDTQASLEINELAHVLSDAQKGEKVNRLPSASVHGND